MKVSEYTTQYPMYAIDFTAQLRQQIRVFDGAILDQFPLELEPEHPYSAGGRGRPNLNQTRTHSQCATCQRVLRNDLFYTVPSMMRRNVVFSHCRECSQQLNATRYVSKADIIRSRRISIWHFLAPRCAICGFDKHPSALDLHHPDHKESLVDELIAIATLSTNAGKLEALLREAAKCIPLCSNCHRMVHANAVRLPADFVRPKYLIANLLLELKSLE